MMLTEYALKMISAPRTDENPMVYDPEKGPMCRFDEVRIVTEIEGPEAPVTSAQLFWKGEMVSVQRFASYRQAMGDSLILTHMHGWFQVTLTSSDLQPPTPAG